MQKCMPQFFVYCSEKLIFQGILPLKSFYMTVAVTVLLLIFSCKGKERGSCEEKKSDLLARFVEFSTVRTLFFTVCIV